MLATGRALTLSVRELQLLAALAAHPGAIVGRAELTFFSVNDGAPAWAFWEWPWTVRWNRLFSIVR